MKKRHWKMIKIEPCKGCGRPLIQHKIANLVVRLEPVPLGVQEAVAELLAGRALWAVEDGKVRTARVGEPGPVREHRCTENAQTAVSRPPVALPGKETTPGPKDRPAGSQTPSWGRQTESSGARRAETRHSSPLVPCSLCGGPIDLSEVETYVKFQLGASLVDIFHTGECPARR